MRTSFIKVILCGLDAFLYIHHGTDAVAYTHQLTLFELGTEPTFQ